MPLPTCECNNGLPIQQQLANIYCALLEILNGGGGEISLSQISDLDASWIPKLQAPFGNFSIIANQISDSSVSGVSLLTSPLLGENAQGNPIVVDDAGAVHIVTGVVTDTQTPVTSITTVAGSVTAMS